MDAAGVGGEKLSTEKRSDKKNMPAFKEALPVKVPIIVVVFTSSRLVVGQIICKGVLIVYFVILMCVCVRGIAYVKIPKVALKNIKYCLCSGR